MTVAPYHTDSPRVSSQERAYYHDNDECPVGRKLFNSSKSALGEDRQEGTGDKPRCPRC